MPILEKLEITVIYFYTCHSHVIAFNCRAIKLSLALSQTPHHVPRLCVIAIMALPLSLRTSVTPYELEFIATQQLVEIVPLISMEKTAFIAVRIFI